MVIKRAVTVVIVLLVIVESAFAGSLAVAVWILRKGIFGDAPPEFVTSATLVSIALAAGTIINVAALVAFLARPRPFGWWALVTFQVAVSAILAVVDTLIAVTDAPLFVLAPVVAALTALLLVAARPVSAGSRG